MVTSNALARTVRVCFRLLVDFPFFISPPWPLSVFGEGDVWLEKPLSILERGWDEVNLLCSCNTGLSCYAW